jgi:hypothetical protein
MPQRSFERASSKRRLTATRICTKTHAEQHSTVCADDGLSVAADDNAYRGRTANDGIPPPPRTPSLSPSTSGLHPCLLALLSYKIGQKRLSPNISCLKASTTLQMLRNVRAELEFSYFLFRRAFSTCPLLKYGLVSRLILWRLLYICPPCPLLAKDTYM